MPWEQTGNVRGPQGLSAYEIAIAEGYYEGTLLDWLESLRGLDGDRGDQGRPGRDGAPGTRWLIASFSEEVDGALNAPDNNFLLIKEEFEFTGEHALLNSAMTDTITHVRQGDVFFTFEDEAHGPVGQFVTTLRGPIGFDGEKGDPGEPGPQGPQGPAGQPGQPGANGVDGNTLISVNTAGPTVFMGKDGDVAWSYTNDIVWGPKAGGVWPAGRSLRGPTGSAGSKGDQGATGTKGDTGPQGPRGSAILTTAGTPQANLGLDGDFAYDPSTEMMYGPRVSGAWPPGAVLGGLKIHGVLNEGDAPPAGTPTGAIFLVRPT